jgi:hypothetical protein
MTDEGGRFLCPQPDSQILADFDITLSQRVWHAM